MRAPARMVVAAIAACTAASRTKDADAGSPVTRSGTASAIVPAAYATRTETSSETPRLSPTVIVVVPTVTPVM